MDIAELTSWAKEFMLKDGSHAPTLFVRTDKQMVVAEVRDLPPTPDERVLSFRAMGRKMGRERKGETLAEVDFIVMAWASLQAPGTPAPKMRPSQDPNRIEVLTISQMLLTEGGIEHHGETVQIIRDGKGKVVDLYHMQSVEGGSPDDDALLSAFIKGFASGGAPPTPPAPPAPRFNPETGEGRHGKPPRQKK